MKGKRSKIAIVASVAAMATLGGCGDEKKTEIRWTSYGVPHIKAENYVDLGEGLGYVMAQDRYCNIVQVIAKAKGELSQHLGAGVNNINVNSDFGYLHLGTYQQADNNFANLDSRTKDLMNGFATGFTHAVAKKKHYNDDCLVTINSITGVDVYAMNLTMNYWPFIGEYIQQVGSAQPQQAGSGQSPSEIIIDEATKSLAELAKGSNGWALGKNMTSSGKGMILSNTHLQHRDEFMWYEAHLTIPDKIDVYGGFLPGFVTPALGFNDSFAWTHTWTRATTGSIYALSATDANSLNYQYDDEIRELTSTDYQVKVKASDGSLSSVDRRLYSSHYGPIMSFGDDESMLAIKDAPSLTINKPDFWLKLALSNNVEQAVKLIEQGYRTGSQNIIMADSNGNTFYADLAQVPQLSEQAWQIIAQVPELNHYNGLLLDGSSSLFEWLDVAPYDDIPKRRSNSYVQNANEAPWLVNIEQPIDDYSLLYGPVEYAQSPRTQLGLVMLETFKQSDEKVNLAALHHTMTDKRVYLAELVVDDLVERCQAINHYEVDGEVVDLTSACKVLENWDKKANLESVGSHLFREYATQLQLFKNEYGCLDLCWQQPFDVTAPLTTPSGLPNVTDVNDDLHLAALANSVLLLEQANLSLSAALKSYQQLVKGDESYPLAGGMGDLTGSYSTVNVSVNDDENFYSYSGLSDNGYDISVGDGFVFLLEFTEQGPNAQSVLLYSQANNPSSSHYFDQASLVDGQFKNVLFLEKSIKADANYRKETLRIN